MITTECPFRSISLYSFTSSSFVRSVTLYPASSTVNTTLHSASEPFLPVIRKIVSVVSAVSAGVPTTFPSCRISPSGSLEPALILYFSMIRIEEMYRSQVLTDSDHMPDLLLYTRHLLQRPDPNTVLYM